MLNKIVMNKKNKTIMLRDEQENVIWFGGDDKTICDTHSLNVVSEVLNALGYNMQPDDDIDAPVEIWTWTRVKK